MLATAVALAGCGGASSGAPGGRAPALFSSAFAPGGPIPRQFTCDGRDVSPPISWARLPAGTSEVALTVEDLDTAGRYFVHWAVAGIAARNVRLTAGRLPHGAVQGRNGFGRDSYSGPCPPRGQSHRYRFVIYALRQPLALAPGFSLASQGAALARDTAAVAELIGSYRRP
ncbi:MAG: hypothetical protein NVSMB51_07440 [Solirubrobacteraceae bacterium]